MKLNIILNINSNMKKKIFNKTNNTLQFINTTEMDIAWKMEITREFKVGLSWLGLVVV